MSTITKEWLQQKIADMEAARDEIPFGLDEDDSYTLAALRIALASIEAEPVAWRYRFVHTPKSEEHGSPFTTDWVLTHCEDDCNPSDCFERQPLYTAPPAPVSIPDEWRQWIADAVEYLEGGLEADGELEAEGSIDAKRLLSRRAAMLQGADGNSPVIPAWQAKAEKLAELHGSSFVVFRNGESPQCADPTKVIISFTDEGLGHGSAAPQS